MKKSSASMHERNFSENIISFNNNKSPKFVKFSNNHKFLPQKTYNCSKDLENDYK